MKDFLYRLLRPILTMFFIIIFRPKIIGKENIPSSGKIVLAGNHMCILDPILVLCCTKRIIHFLAKIELIKGPFGFIFKNLGIIPVDRKIKDKSVMPAANKILENNGVIGIFPEGTINRTDDVTMRFKTGAVRLANENKCKIVPFAITSKYRLFGNRVCIYFDKPYSVSDNVIKENEILRDKISKMIIEGGSYGRN